LQVRKLGEKQYRIWMVAIAAAMLALAIVRLWIGN